MNYAEFDLNMRMLGYRDIKTAKYVLDPDSGVPETPEPGVILHEYDGVVYTPTGQLRYRVLVDAETLAVLIRPAPGKVLPVESARHGGLNHVIVDNLHDAMLAIQENPYDG